MATTDGDLQLDCNSELRDLRQKVINLEEELTDCKNQLLALQKELNHTEVLYNDAKCCNEELYKQVNDLSEKLHERKKKESNKTDVEIQTDLCFTHENRDFQKEDLDFHYHLRSDQNDAWQVSGPLEDSTSVLAQSQTQPQTDCSQFSETVQTDSYQCTDYPDESAPPDGSGDHKNVDETTGDSKNISLAESLRVTAEAAMSQTGFMYDGSSGLYYDYSTGFYYDSTNQLYYDPNTGIYYYYDAGSGLYQFHSRVDLLAYQTADTEKKVKKKRKGVEKLELKEEKDIEAEISKASSNCRFWDLKENELPSAEKRKKTKMVDIDQSSSNGLNSNLGLSIQGEEDVEVKLEEAGFASEPEEGEITDSEKSSLIDEETEESGEGEDDFMNEGHLWPPCIRVMVVRSPVLEPGTLFIITAEKSATIGREKDMGHAIRIAELGVSKFHAEVYFDQDLQKYMLVDKGSQNGTVVNGNRILAVKNKCDPQGLEHGDEVKFGETVLSFHIHPGSETCNGCEPGQVIAHLRLNKKEESVAVPVLSKEEKDKLRRHELKQIQVKYGLQNSAYERGNSMKNLIYKDRAAKRRQEIGSDGIFKRDDAPASIHMEICDDNKGRKMLEKMGWKKGEGLGKGSCGIKEPIQVQLHQSQSGLGAKIPLSIEDAQLYSSKNHKNWAKARARFSEAFQQTSSQKEADTKICAKTECKKRDPEDSTI
ncbi:angiogenic factor with G patch and FHA domains 1 isoform X1 [Hypanus sabinus]|uniref:angiogenic factor with G patch and FHA domains 1 isoform X1 n=1 Tax=Hypanus sabinus TaxID=79690 RepID=UPI0028C4792F|nr:angiogenic factor with G patch and FHA domains 1 isoform X1 [Hypanus sabinus]XP_059830480.1 angiogenic factor with G patch and FHA domains 1 isoform X1 [Hypanus sabinus]